MVASPARGRFVWHELMTSDPKAAIAFYPKVIGWTPQAFPGMADYTVWNVNGTGVGGLMKAEGTMPSHWLGYISTPSVDDTVKRAADLGARTIVPGTDIPDVGRFAILMDPQGVVFAVFSPKPGSSRPEGQPGPGEFSWHELITTDPAAGLAFYETLFGWEKTSAMDMGEMGVYQMFGFDGVPFGGAMKKADEMPAPMWSHYVLIDDVNRGVEAVKANGGQVINGPMEVPGGDMIANCLDPQGVMFSIHALAAK